jgi:hypothetical protein
LARILDGTDYIVKVSYNGVEVVVLGASGTSTPAASGPAIARSDITVMPAVVPPPPSKSIPPAAGPILPAAGPILPSSAPPPPLAAYLSADTPP